MRKDGRARVMEDEMCEEFPWVPPTLWEALGESLIRKDGSTVATDSLRGETLGLYFSAHWCPPCRGFTPQLKKFYEEYKASDPNFEIIFVSSDKDEQGMLDYFKADHGDYLALPFAKRAEKKELSDMFGVEGIPTFVVVGADGQTLNANARGKVVGGASSVLAGGWEPPAVGDMAEGPEAAGTDINETAAVVVMCAGAGADEQLEMLTKKDAGDVIAAAGDRPVTLLFDIPDNGGFYLSGAHEITSESVAAFLKMKEDGELRRLQLGRG